MSIGHCLGNGCAVRYAHARIGRVPVLPALPAGGGARIGRGGSSTRGNESRPELVARDAKRRAPWLEGCRRESGVSVADVW